MFLGILKREAAIAAARVAAAPLLSRCMVSMEPLDDE